MRTTTRTHGTFAFRSVSLREGEQLAFANTSLHRKKWRTFLQPPYSRRDMATRADGLMSKPRLKATEESLPPARNIPKLHHCLCCSSDLRMTFPAASASSSAKVTRSALTSMVTRCREVLLVRLCLCKMFMSLDMIEVLFQTSGCTYGSGQRLQLKVIKNKRLDL